jgi:hypothetical protein
MTVREAILRIVEDKFRVEYGRICTVKSVDTTTLTCTVETLDTDAEITEVRLQAGEGVGLIMIPKVGSIVIVMEVVRFDYAVVLYSEIDSIKMLDGSFGGLVKVGVLVSRLNEVEDKLNTLLSIYNSHTHPAHLTPTPSRVTGQVAKTTRADIENTLVTHGKL